MKHAVAPDTDRWDFWALFDAGEWEPETLEIIDRFIEPGDVFLDVGAWIGPLSLYAAQRGGRAIALEPDPVACANLRTNVELNESDVFVIEAALAPEPGTVSILPMSGAYGGSMTRVAYGGLHVPAITIHELDLTGCTLAKMDVEGYEIVLLPVVAPVFAELGIALFVTWHEGWWRRAPDLSVRRRWFDGFSHLDGVFGGWETLLAVP